METWSADFMADALWSGRRFRTFNVVAAVGAMTFAILVWSGKV